MSVPVFDAWLDDDGVHVWIEHPCLGGMERTKLPQPNWAADAVTGAVSPSVHCMACGAHQFVNVNAERWYAREPIQDHRQELP